MSRPTFGSLFAGIGGFDLGFERAGWECKWQVEIDSYATQVLEAHWPHVARFRDVREFAPHGSEHTVDCIVGGFPCQDLSVAGKRAGLKGERSGLFWEFVRVVSLLRPEFLVLENVPGLLSSEGGRDMGAVIGGLADIGYCCAWRVLDAQYFGVAQQRRRVFIVGCVDPHRAAAVLFECDGGARDSAAVRKAGEDIACCLDGGAGGVSAKENQRTIVSNTIDAHYGAKWGSNQWVDNGHAVIQPTITSRIGKGGFTDPVNDGIIAHTLRAEGFDGSEDGTGRGTPLVPDRMRAVAGVPGPLDLCEVCAQGPDAPRYKAIGNAVVPQVAEWIARRIVNVSSQCE